MTRKRTLRFLITAGPTREYLDAVRFLSNPSTGRMGFAVAAAAVRAGHQATLVAGPVSLPTPAGVRRIDVVSAIEMRDAVRACYGECDAVVATAAVCDYRPAERAAGKIKKGDGDLVLRLVRNPDILAELGADKGGRVLIGFALEAQDAEDNARRKLAAKNLDAVVLNAPAAFAAERSSVMILKRDGAAETLTDAAKSEIAAVLVALVEELAADRRA